MYELVANERVDNAKQTCAETQIVSKIQYIVREYVGTGAVNHLRYEALQLNV